MSSTTRSVAFTIQRRSIARSNTAISSSNQLRRSLATSRPNLRAPANDPWAKREAWRHSPTFGNLRQIGKMFPGFGLAVVAFGAYLAYDSMAGEEHAHH